MDFNMGRELLELAVRRDELDLFLQGSALYRLGTNIYAPGRSMLDIEPTMGEVYRYYKDEPDKRVDLDLEKTILEYLTWHSGRGVYAAFTIIRYQLMNEKMNKAPFKINYEKIKKEFDKAYIFHTENLKKLKEYEGETLKEGLWEAMQIDNRISIEDYGIDILG